MRLIEIFSKINSTGWDDVVRTGNGRLDMCIYFDLRILVLDVVLKCEKNLRMVWFSLRYTYSVELDQQISQVIRSFVLPLGKVGLFVLNEL